MRCGVHLKERAPARVDRRDGIVMVRAVGFIENKNDPRTGFTKKLGDLFIDGINSGSGIDNEDDGVGR